MRKNQFIFAGIFSAYLMMLVHLFVPHHHHETKEEADRHHQSEHTSHIHHSQENEGHDHSTHFVHPSHYEDYVVSPSFKFNDISRYYFNLLLIEAITVQSSLTPFFDEVRFFPDLPPPNLTYLPLPNGLRGSPVFIS
ncbi:MAG: hypothetical protein IPM47_09340 [Sphingobacteriales bacterium]|nr:MAG: hypothetical protein IPM47_09340 [Sphingobacteriales bacterium]